MSHSRVLVVEDHPASRKMLESMLLKSYEVMSAESGTQAIEIAKNKKPDLVLLDIEMPGLDGFQTQEILKSGIIDQATPVIFLTAREDSKSREKGLEAGAVDYITKPYDKQELSIKVKNHLALFEAHKEIEARNKVMAREMEMASQLQNSLLPQDLPRLDNLSLYAYYKPVSEAGGDFYDIIELPGSRLGFVQVDVSGHGVASAMVGAMFKMAFQSFARLTNSTAGLLKVINDEMFKILPDSDFLTVFYGIINVETLELTFTNAGHPKPLLFKKSNETISFYQSDLDSYGITSIQSIELTVEAMDSSSWETLVTGDVITLTTDAPRETQALDDSGIPALDQNGLQIVVRGVKTDDGLWGPEVMLYLSNQTGRDITVQADDFSVNGYMITPILSCNVIDGKVAYSTIYLDAEELEKNGIDQIDTIECTFVVCDPNTWDTIFESGPVTIQIPNYSIKTGVLSSKKARTSAPFVFDMPCVFEVLFLHDDPCQQLSQHRRLLEVDLCAAQLPAAERNTADVAIR